MKRRINLGFLFFCLVFVSNAQNTNDLENKLQDNKRKLALSKRVLKETKSQQRSTLKTLTIYENQIRLRNEVLTELENDLQRLEYSVESAKEEISGITSEISRIKHEFSESVIAGYKSNKKLSKLHYIFLSSSFNDLIRRINYLDRILDFRKLQLGLIEEKKKENSVKINRLIKTQKELASSRVKKAEEIEQLALDKENYTRLIKNLKSKEAQLVSEIQRRERLSLELQNKIKTAISEAKSKRVESSSTSEIVSGFSRKSLPWPVNNGYISERYGRHKHQDFKNVTTQNNGINILCEENTSATAVHTGIVSAIIEVPGMQTTVLVKHGEYYSVYGNLSSVEVERGQTVKLNDIIGVVGSNGNGITELHFEIWKGTTKLNPENWIQE